MPTYFAPIDQRVVNRALKETGFEGIPFAILISSEGRSRSFETPTLSLPESDIDYFEANSFLFGGARGRSRSDFFGHRTLVFTTQGVWFRDCSGSGWRGWINEIEEVRIGTLSCVWQEEEVWIGGYEPCLVIHFKKECAAAIVRFDLRSLGYTSPETADEDFLRIIHRFEREKYWNHLNVYIQSYDEDARAYWLVVTTFHGEPLLNEFEWYAEYLLTDKLMEAGLKNSSERGERSRNFEEAQLIVAGTKTEVAKFLSEPMVDFRAVEKAEARGVRARNR